MAKNQADEINGGVETSDNDKPIITVDVEKYEHLLEDPDLTDEQRAEFLQTMWNIIVNFVDLGFGVHPVQQVLELPCGKDKNISSKATLTATNELISNDRKLCDNFINSVNLEKETVTERNKP